jgi:hypothetical protein
LIHTIANLSDPHKQSRDLVVLVAVILRPLAFPVNA